MPTRLGSTKPRAHRGVDRRKNAAQRALAGMPDAIVHVGEQHHVAVRDVPREVRARARRRRVVRVEHLRPRLVEVHEHRRAPVGTYAVRDQHDGAHRLAAGRAERDEALGAPAVLRLLRVRIGDARDAPERCVGRPDVTVRAEVFALNQDAVRVLRHERRSGQVVQHPALVLVQAEARAVHDLRCLEQHARYAAVRIDARETARVVARVDRAEQDRLVARERDRVRIGLHRAEHRARAAALTVA